MTETKPHSEWKEKTVLRNLTPCGLAAMGEKGIEEFAEAQAELFSILQETHRRWLDRVQSEARLALELTRRMTNAHSIPDAMAACQEWTSRHLDMMVDDSNQLLAGPYKFAEVGARFLSKGLSVNGQDASVNAAGDRPPVRAHSQASPATTTRQRATARSDSFGDDAAPVQSF